MTALFGELEAEPYSVDPVIRLDEPRHRNMASYAEFLRGLAEDPSAVSAPTPSGQSLSQAIAAEVEPERPGLVVELGPGTGVVTEALIRRGIPPERIWAIESGEYFCDLLKKRYRTVHVCLGNAFRFERYLPPQARVAGVVSGVPLLNFPSADRKTLIERALAIQEDGAFIQLSYGWRRPVPANSAITVNGKLVWRNLPPAHIWIYRWLHGSALSG